jgi:hypothetical protein
MERASYVLKELARFFVKNELDRITAQYHLTLGNLSIGLSIWPLRPRRCIFSDSTKPKFLSFAVLENDLIEG